MEFVGGPKDGEVEPTQSWWTPGTVVRFRTEPEPESPVLHHYQVQEKPSGERYFMYVGAAREP